MTTLLECADWSFPIPIKYGPGRLGELGALCRDAGIKRPLLVTDRGSRDLPFIDQAQAALAGVGIVGKLFSEVAPNPTDENVAVGREVFRGGDHDGVIAIGGDPRSRVNHRITENADRLDRLRRAGPCYRSVFGARLAPDV